MTERPAGRETPAERLSRLAGETRPARIRRLIGSAWALPGPGVVTGASDDDPSGIATYSLAGAQTGYSLLWTSLITLPLNAAVQNMCARIGLTTGTGLAAVLRRHYSRWLLMVLVTLLFVANTINIGADVAAVTAGVDLLTGIPESVIVAPVGIVIAASEIFVPYRVFANYLKVLTLALFAYVVDGFLAGPDWLQAVKHTFLPSIHFDATFISTLVAVLGTTISPYLFFW
jgi:NRAMP (natural resistance-associated macrophage protein)-like metal ion transporter